MSEQIPRRQMLRHLMLASATVAVPGLLLACSRKPSCSDVTGLTPDELAMRNGTAAYVEQTMDASKKCSGCAQWVAAPTPTACGGCKVVKGPINPEGWCKLFVAKT